jgi:hypothetical protein
MDFSQHSCTNVFTAVADLQVQCLYFVWSVKPFYYLDYGYFLGGGKETKTIKIFYDFP